MGVGEEGIVRSTCASQSGTRGFGVFWLSQTKPLLIIGCFSIRHTLPLLNVKYTLHYDYTRARLADDAFC